MNEIGYTLEDVKILLVKRQEFEMADDVRDVLHEMPILRQRIAELEAREQRLVELVKKAYDEGKMNGASSLCYIWANTKAKVKL